jgi:hypothetical protein
MCVIAMRTKQWPVQNSQEVWEQRHPSPLRILNQCIIVNFWIVYDVISKTDTKMVDVKNAYTSVGTLDTDNPLVIGVLLRAQHSGRRPDVEFQGFGVALQPFRHLGKNAWVYDSL